MTALYFLYVKIGFRYDCYLSVTMAVWVLFPSPNHAKNLNFADGSCDRKQASIWGKQMMAFYQHFSSKQTRKQAELISLKSSSIFSSIKSRRRRRSLALTALAPVMEKTCHQRMEDVKRVRCQSAIGAKNRPFIIITLSVEMKAVNFELLKR